MTAKSSKIEFIRHIAFMLAILLLACNFGYAWFRDHVYAGRNMQYVKTLHVGSNEAAIATYVGVKNEEGGIVYQPLYIEVDNDGTLHYDYQHCAELTSLLPGERQYFYTEVTNLCTDTGAADMNVSLFLEDIYYSDRLDKQDMGYSYLYFAVTSPEVSMRQYYGTETFTTGIPASDYTGGALVSADDVFSHIGAVPLARQQKIASGDTLRIYWYLYLDTEADNECIGSTVIFETMRLTFNS